MNLHRTRLRCGDPSASKASPLLVKIVARKELLQDHVLGEKKADKMEVGVKEAELAGCAEREAEVACGGSF